MFNKVTAMYIGNHFDHYSKAQSVDELKRMVFKRCEPHITNMDTFSRGAKLVDWNSLYKAILTF